VSKTLRILVVDDSAGVRKGIRNILNSGSEEWTICGDLEDGEELVARAGESKPDVILLDLSVARLSGLGLIKTLNEMLPHVAIIVMSDQEPSVLRYLTESLALHYFVSKSRLATDLVPQLEAISRSKKSQ
jgi:DNA-binding NarL/FixJ family response regulator